MEIQKSKCGEFKYLVENSEAKVVEYLGKERHVFVPEAIDGYTVTRVSSWFFCPSKMDYITIPRSVTHILQASFEDNDFDTCSFNPLFSEIPDLDDDETKMDENEGANIKEYCLTIDIPNSVTYIEGLAVSRCSNIILCENHPVYYFEDGVLYDKRSQTLHTYLNTNTQEQYTIPSFVKRIGHSAFGLLDSIVSITIPSSVTYIETCAFFGCERLREVHIPHSVIFIGGGAFSSCTALREIDLPCLLKSIEPDMFSGCVMLERVSIPSSVTEIHRSAFSNCESLASIELPESIIKIGYDAFFNCTKIERLEIPYGVTVIDVEFANFCSNLRSVIIPSSVTAIETKAFCNCKNLKSLCIPSSVIHIEKNAFGTYNDCCCCDDDVLQRIPDYTGFSLTVIKDSYAHLYAVENGVPFEFYV